MRYGKTVHFVEKQFDKKTANVVSNLITLGHTSVGDLRDAYFPPAESFDVKHENVNGAHTESKIPNGTTLNGDAAQINGNTNVNGHAVNGESHSDRNSRDDGSLASPEELNAVIQNLISSGWVIQVAEAQYLSGEEMHMFARQQAIDELWGTGGAPTGTNDKVKLQLATMEQKRRIRDTWLEAPRLSSKKRKLNESDHGGSNKRVKVNGIGQYESLGTLPEDEPVIRVNPEKIAVAMRKQQLVQLVEQRMGYTTACIYEILMSLLEKETPRCFEEFPDPPVPPPKGTAPKEELFHKHVVNSRDIANKAKANDLDLCEGLDLHAIVSITKSGMVNKDGSLSVPVNSSELGFHERLGLVEAHLHLLSDDPFHFVIWYARGQWRVDFEQLAKSLIQHEIENTVLARKGSVGLKLLRALKKKGKLDERQTCNAMLMSANDFRGIVNDLTVQGFVQTQEIPKVDRREAKLSLHLIWYDVQRAREKLLHDTYKGLVRILQRLAFEREKVQLALTKSERSDVVGKESLYLKQEELESLRKWKEVQEKLLLQLHREDDLVATLRDFAGPLVSV